jgi:hypothetical protein
VLKCNRPPFVWTRVTLHVAPDREAFTNTSRCLRLLLSSGHNCLVSWECNVTFRNTTHPLLQLVACLMVPASLSSRD